MDCPQCAAQPISQIVWIDRNLIRPNDYNPNHQAPPEHQLLKISILSDGWTQPIVCGTDMVIIDGEHRWTVSEDPEIFALTNGHVPVVFVDRAHSERMLATIRHNRARGEHAISEMASIVKKLIEVHGMSPDDVCFYLQMESEEVSRLAESLGMPALVFSKAAEFNKGWVPK